MGADGKISLDQVADIYRIYEELYQRLLDIVLYFFNRSSWTPRLLERLPMKMMK